ncbi:MAG: sigma-70 family RNA polymerase sigma factor [Planctomycetota bacterium]|jgi:RNA polymerase sigma-70 factor (ECF subfamily)|nr:sigma-70 family RNA polymerase sigma factor [Planctomycetota bacterium]
MDTELHIGGCSLRQLVDEHLAALRAYLASCGAHAELIDDLAQDVFLEVMRHHERYDPQRPFRAWLFGIARNLIHQEFRTSALRSRIRRDLVASLLLEQPPVVDPAEPLLRREASEQLRSCLQGLDERAQTLLRLRFSEQLSGEAIAAHTGIRHGTVRMALLRARSALRACLEQHFGAER